MGTYPATDTGGALEALIVLSVHANVDPHLAITAAIAAGDTHVVLDGYSKSTKLLNQTHQPGQWAEEPTPDPTAEKRIQAHSKNSGKQGDHHETINTPNF